MNDIIVSEKFTARYCFVWFTLHLYYKLTETLFLSSNIFGLFGLFKLTNFCPPNC